MFMGRLSGLGVAACGDQAVDLQRECQRVAPFAAADHGRRAVLHGVDEGTDLGQQRVAGRLLKGLAVDRQLIRVQLVEQRLRASC